MTLLESFLPIDWLSAAATLLHVLVFVYWLGGDLGAFYASRIVTDPTQAPAARGAAAKVLANVDMAPRTALILAFPTGLTLVALKGWADVAPLWIAAAWAVSLAWLALAWTIHVRHLPPAALVRRIDLAIRWAALALLAGLAIGPWEAPVFIRFKIALLGAAIVCGLVIRARLAPFGPAFAAMLSQGSTPEGEAVINRSLAGARPFVMAIWTCLLLAALLGLATPL